MTYFNNVLDKYRINLITVRFSDLSLEDINNINFYPNILDQISICFHVKKVNILLFRLTKYIRTTNPEET